jgi:hypothetical protein
MDILSCDRDVVHTTEVAGGAGRSVCFSVFSQLIARDAAGAMPRGPGSGKRSAVMRIRAVRAG